ncbi:hypothetical protein [Pasteurella sp. PK-2025]|uniref:hypothetical protein n=1 Tax=unclassified Pasteurella TaxID=2621516 RepID=UPI003C70A5BC
MREICNKNYFKKDFGEILNYQDIVFRKVVFDNCTVGLDNDINNLNEISDIRFNDCSFIFCTFGSAIFNNVLFNNIKFQDYGIFWSPFLNKVPFEGKISSFRINSNGFMLDKNPELNNNLNQLRANFYKNIEWALDISKAKLSSFDYSGIPSHLFIRDPDTQFVVKKEKFNSLDLLDKRFKDKFDAVMIYLEDFLNSNENDKVITVPLARPKKYKQPILEGLQELRRLGFAEKE